MQSQGSASVREGWRCSSCGADHKHRLQAAAILATFGRGRYGDLQRLVSSGEAHSLAVYEVGIRGPLAVRLSRLPRYRNSFYRHDVPPGTESDGIQCQDLECLTFEDRSFDLVLSQDVLEHVPNLRVALSETYRVLKPGGAHIFTVKASWPWPEHTIERTRQTPEGLEHIYPPKYYPSSNGAPPSLLFRDIGADVIPLLKEIGFTTLVLRDYSLYPQIVTFSLIALRP